MRDDTGGSSAKATSKARGRDLPKTLTYDELDRLLCACEDLEDLAFIHAGLFGGLRLAEITGLTRADIDPDAVAVYVKAEDAKGDKDRWAPVTPVTVALLHVLGQSKRADEPLFTLTPRTYERRVKALAVAAGIEKDITPHWLRHTSATMQLDMGIDLETVRDNLGHEDITYTQIYLHLNIRSRSRKYRDAMRTVL